MTLLHEQSSADIKPKAKHGYDILSPFFVYPNAGEIYTAYPELADLAPIPINLFNESLLSDDNLKDYGVPRDVRRELAVDERLHFVAQRAFLAAIHTLAPIESPSRRAMVYQKLVADWEQSRQVNHAADPMLKLVIDKIDIESGTAYVSAVNNLAGPIQQRLLEAVKDSTYDQYSLLKAIISVQSEAVLQDKDDGAQSPDFQALRWLVLMATANPTVNRASSLAEPLQRSTDSDIYNPYIAHDMLRYANFNLNGGSPPEALSEAKRMIELFKHTNGTSLDAAGVARLAEGLEMKLWSKESLVSVKRHQKILSDNLGLIRKAVREFTTDVHKDEGTDYQDFLYRSFDELAGVDHHRNLAEAVRSVGHVAAEHLGNKRRHLREAAQVDNETEPEVETKQEKEPLILMYVDGQGALHEAESKEFSNLVEDYLKKYQHTPNLPEDIARILEHLTHLDFSNGIIHGLIRVTEGYAPVILNGAQAKDMPVWEFKPKEAIGLSLKSNAATRTRLYLSVIPGANIIAIRDIGRRSDSNARDLNKRSGRRRRHR